MMTVEEKQESVQVPERRGCAGIFFCVMLVLGSVWGAALGVFVWVLEDAQTTIEALEDFRPKIGSKVYADDGGVLGELARRDRSLVRLSEMPLHLQKAFIATEDATFYLHKGVRPDAIVSAVLRFLRTGNMRGGSTITQQLVRNVEALSIGQERTLQRKLREAVVSLQVEREFTKDEIIELYLNQIFLGISAYGVEAASKQYFAKSCRDVTLGEAATLAGLTRSPNRNDPIRNPKNALKRRDVVLKQMREHAFITEEEYAAALGEDLQASVITPAERVALRAVAGKQGKKRQSGAYFFEEVRKKLLQEYGEEDVFENGLEVRTTIDLRLQGMAEEVLSEALEAFDERKLAALMAAGKSDEFVPVSGALVCLDNRAPYRGFVRAMVGGRDFNVQKFNNATQAKRQPGSSVKPFVWAAAIDNGLSPSTVIIDEPFERLDGAGEPWVPENFGELFEGPISLRHALEKSVNIVSIKLVEQLGMPLVRSYLERCGFTTPIGDEVGLTLALGTPVVNLLDLSVAYSTFANGGVRYDPVLITEILNRDGLQRHHYGDYATNEQALDPKVAYVVNHMLQGVCTPSPRFSATGRRTARLARPRGGKTGTTNDSRNVWFSGFTREYTCVVWIGYLDNRPLGTGLAFTGGALASPIWTEFMVRAHEGLPVRDFEVPYGITFYNIDRITGVLGGDYREAYIATGPRPPTEWYGDLYAAEEESETALIEAL